MRSSRSTRTAICLGISTAAVVLGAAGCEIRERSSDPDAMALDTVRAAPVRSSPDPAAPGSSFAPADEGPLEVGDEFWAGSETVGWELVGEFVSDEALRSSLDLDLAIAPSGDRVWRLGDILVALDLSGEGPSAVWRVVGPGDVVDAYVEGLRGSAAGRSPVTDLGALPLEVRYCCGTGSGAGDLER